MKTEMVMKDHGNITQDFALIGAEQLCQLIPVSMPTIWRWEHDKEVDFPKRIKVAGGKVFWRRRKVEEWIESKQEYVDGKT